MVRSNEMKVTLAVYAKAKEVAGLLVKPLYLVF